MKVLSLTAMFILLMLTACAGEDDCAIHPACSGWCDVNTSSQDAYNQCLKQYCSCGGPQEPPPSGECEPTVACRDWCDENASATAEEYEQCIEEQCCSGPPGASESSAGFNPLKPNASVWALGPVRYGNPGK